MILRQPGKILPYLRFATGVVLLLTTLLLLVSLPGRFAQLNRVSDRLDLQSGTLGPEEVAALAVIGIEIPEYAGYITFVEGITASVGILVGAIIFLRRRNDLMALFVSMALITLGTFPTPLMSSIAGNLPWASGLVALLQFIALGPSFLVFYLFPDGRFAPPWTRWFAYSWIVYSMLWLVYPSLKPPITLFAVEAVSGVSITVIMVWMLAGIYSQVHRYRHISTPVQRQQTKWIVFGFSITLVALVVVGGIIRVLGLDTTTSSGMLVLIAGITIILVVLSISPVTVMISILQYRLWDIDIVIRRTLSYTILTTILAGVYFGGVVSLQAAIRGFTSQTSSPIVTILTTLVVAGIFNPLRLKVQGFIDRRFYRSKYVVEQTLDDFAVTARDEVDLERLASELLSVVEDTMQPERTSLWLREVGAGMEKRHSQENDQ